MIVRKSIWLLLLTLFFRNDGISCNCRPPKPNLRTGKKPTEYEVWQEKYRGYDAIMLTKILSVKDVFIGLDTNLSWKKYQELLLREPMRKTHYSFQRYLYENQGIEEMREYKAVVIKSIKNFPSINDTISIFSDNSNCGMYFEINELYEVGGTIWHRPYSYRDKNGLRISTVVKNSIGVSWCSCKYANSLSFRYFDMKWID